MIKNTMSMPVEPITTECQRTLIIQTIPKDGKVGGPYPMDETPNRVGYVRDDSGFAAPELHRRSRLRRPTL